MHSGKFTWNLKMTFQTSIFGFQVNFRGCKDCNQEIRNFESSFHLKSSSLARWNLAASFEDLILMISIEVWPLVRQMTPHARFMSKSSAASHLRAHLRGRASRTHRNRKKRARESGMRAALKASAANAGAEVPITFLVHLTGPRGGHPEVRCNSCRNWCTLGSAKLAYFG